VDAPSGRAATAWWNGDAAEEAPAAVRDGIVADEVEAPASNGGIEARTRRAPMRCRLGLVTGSAAVVLAGAAALAGGRGTAEEGRADPLVELGRRLFFDPAVSRTGTVACSTCHDPDHGFSDRRRLSPDELGFTQRHSQSVADVVGAFGANGVAGAVGDAARGGFHWDGEFRSVRDLLFARLGPVHEASAAATKSRDAALTAARKRTDGGFLDEAVSESGRGGYGTDGATRSMSFPPVSARVGTDDAYGPAFRAAFGAPEVTDERVFDALEAYLATVRTAPNRLDRHLAGDRDALSSAALRGWALFDGKAGCANCHVASVRDGRVALTDGRYHDTGVGARKPSPADREARIKIAMEGTDFEDLTARFEEIAIDSFLGRTEFGRASQTFHRDDRLRFKTPSLRDVALRPPYMHDGSFRSLAEVVDYYDGGGTPHPGLSRHVKKLGLTNEEKRDLVAFLEEGLTGSERPGLGAPPADLGHETTARVVDLDGRPVADLVVHVEPAGDRFRGVDVPRDRRTVVTDALGRAVFPFPPTTHARLVADAHGLDGGRILPDSTVLAEVLAVPKDKVALRVTGLTGVPPATLEATSLSPGSTATDGSPHALTFSLARQLDPKTALYVAPAPPREGKKVLVLGDVPDVRFLRAGTGNHLVLATARIDAHGGSLSTAVAGGFVKRRKSGGR
jgi:cytochrome c peroxidase